MAIDDQLPGLNWRVPANTDNLEFRHNILDSEILEGRRLAMSAGTSMSSEGIVSAIDPSSLDGTDTTQPLMVQINPDNVAQVLIFPGTAVTSSGHRIVITSQLTVAILSSNVVGAQTIIYLQYQNEETIPLPVRNRTGDIPSRVSVVAEANMANSLLLADYGALNSVTKTRTVVLALTTVQETDVAGTLESTVDLSTAVVSYNRPWFSAVDAAHRGMVGNGTPTANNPHGLDLNDLAVAGNLPFYQAMIGRGIIIAPDESLPYVPGTACTETIPGTRWLTDTTGDVTSLVNAKYVTLLGYPIALGSCVEIDGNEDTDTAKLLAVRQITHREAGNSPTPRRTNILYVDPAEPIDIAATYEVRYTSVASLEPPVDFNSDPELVFGEPQAREAIVADGLAFNTVPNPTLSTESLGAIPRRIWVLFDDDHGLISVPQVVLPFSRLADAISDKFEVSATLYGPGRVRIWMTDAIPSASLSVPLIINGKDKDGIALSSTVTFDSTWVDNPAPADAEEPSQQLLVDGIYAEITDITVGTRVADGPSTAIVVEFIPEPVYESTDIDHALPVASIFWDGYRAARLTDEREVTINLNKIGPSRADIVGESVLTHHSVWPALGALLVLVAAEDADQMVNSDQRLTRRWSPRGFKGAEDPVLASSRAVGRDSYYYSKAFRGIAGCQWIMVTLLGNPIQIGLSNNAQYRVAVEGDEGTWSAWFDFDQSDATRHEVVPDIDIRPLSFIKYFPDLPGFSNSDAAFKFQVRFSGDWESMVIFASDEDLRTQTFDYLVNALNDAFKIQHWEPATPDEGAHKETSITPVAADAGPGSVPRLEINLHPSDVAALGVDQVLVHTVAGDFSISADGTLTAPADIDAGGDISSSGGISSANNVTAVDTISGQTVTGNVLSFDSDQKIIRTIPKSLFEAVIDTGDINIRDNWSWLNISGKFPGAAPHIFAGHSVNSSSFISLPLDDDTLNRVPIDAVALWVQRLSSGGALSITVRIQSSPITGSGTVWSNEASSVQVISEISGRQAYEFNMSSISMTFSTNMYRLRIECDTAVDVAIIRTALLHESTLVSRMLNSYP